MPHSRLRSLAARPVHVAGIGLLAIALGPMSFTTMQARTYGPDDPATWSDWRLAAQLTVSCVDFSHTSVVRRQAAAGIGGITLLGSHTRAGFVGDLAAGRRAASHGIAPFVMSDEEGGLVQRLRTRIYRLPSAKTMGTWTPGHVRRTAHRYAVRMRKLGVRMDLAPVGDLAIRGRYMDSLHRAFSRDPQRVALMTRAWRLGMHDAGVATAIKHWPGHGHARNSHTGPASVPPLALLERRDMVPFDLEMSRGVEVVMVGHLTSKGLTEPGVPASESRQALHYLRDKAGPDVVVMTDSLTMDAATTSQGITTGRAAVRSLRAGADWALVCNTRPLRAVDKIRDAIKSGLLPREQAVASARRIVALKARYGLAPR